MHHELCSPLSLRTPRQGELYEETLLWGRGKTAGDSSARRAPLACCSALWTQPGLWAPGWDVTKLVSTFLLPHPHPYFVIPVLALPAEWPFGCPEQEARV